MIIEEQNQEKNKKWLAAFGKDATLGK